MSDPTPRDPLLNQTLSVPEGERVESAVPVAYRPVYRPGALQLRDRYGMQGAFKTYNGQGMIEFEWRDIIPTVVLPQPQPNMQRPIPHDSDNENVGNGIGQEPS